MVSKRIETLAKQGREVDVIKPAGRAGATVDPRKDVQPRQQQQRQPEPVPAPARPQGVAPSVAELAIAVWQRAAVQVVLHSHGEEFDENSERIAGRAVDVARHLHAALSAPEPVKQQQSEPADPFNENATSATDEPKAYAERVPDEGHEEP
jgi:hypothetical protein